MIIRYMIKKRHVYKSEQWILKITICSYVVLFSEFFTFITMHSGLIQSIVNNETKMMSWSKRTEILFNSYRPGGKRDDWKDILVETDWWPNDEEEGEKDQIGNYFCLMKNRAQSTEIEPYRLNNLRTVILKSIT